MCRARQDRNSAQDPGHNDGICSGWSQRSLMPEIAKLAPHAAICRAKAK